MIGDCQRFLPRFVRTRLEGRQNLQVIIANTGWLFADKILRMGVGLLVSIWVVRYLGPESFGVLSYATAFVALFTALATLGLDGIVVRELVRHPAVGREILGSAFLLRISAALAMILITVVTISCLRPGDGTTLMLVGLIAAGTFFQATDVIDFWFQSRVMSKYSVIARNAAFLLSAAVKVGLIIGHAPLVSFGGVVLLEAILASAGLLIAYARNGEQIRSWQGSLPRCRELLANSWPLILSGISVAVYMKIDQVMLGSMAGNQAVGIYSSATKISEIWYFIPMTIVSSVFPSIIHAKETDQGLYYRRMQRLFSLMAALSLSIAIPMTFLSTWLVTLLFGNSFAAAGPVLAVHIWASLFVFYGVAQSPWDLTENLTKLALCRISAGALLNVVLNIFLIPGYGAMGAALATVLSQACAAFFLNAAHKRTRPIFLSQVRALFFIRHLRGI
jgi:PST family polysaccharide transporter